MGGNFTEAGGEPRLRVARFLANGTLDAGFSSTHAANAEVRSIALDRSDRLIIGGDFATLSFALNGSPLINFNDGLNGLRFKINRSRGTFSGSFQPTGYTKRVSIQGVLINREFGYGYALVPVSPGASTVLPSRVRLVVENP